MSDRSEGTKRQPYVQPKLVVVGSVRLVTRSAGNKGAADVGGSGSMQKTGI